MNAIARKFAAGVVSALVLAGLCSKALADLPQGLLIIAYDGSNWFPYISQPGNRWKKFADIQNPSYLTWQIKTGRFFIKGDDGKMYQYDLDSKKLKHLESFDDTNNTQLRAYDNGFVMTQLVEGKSRDTHIVSVDNEYNTKLIVRQASAQFHPYRHDDQLYYAHVSCRLECKPIIQEVWRKNLITGRARQLTLLNATSYLYSVDAEGRYGYISSNQKGYYHLARLDLSTGEVVWLTGGQVTDSYPSMARDGSLYFIRRTPAGSRVMRLANQADRVIKPNNPENPPETITLPEGVIKVRFLELDNS